MTTDEPIEVSGKRIVLAGALCLSRAELTAELESRGATVETTVSRVTDLVVKGEGGAPTLYAARDKGVRVVVEEVFLAALGLSPGEAEGAAAQAPIDPATLGGAELVITGRLASVDRTEAAQRLELLGARVVDQVTAGTRLVFAGEKAGTKLFHAREHGIRVVDEAALIAVLAQAPELKALTDEERREAELRKAREKAAEVLETLPGAEVVIAGRLSGLVRANVLKRLAHFGARTAERVTRSTRLLVAGEAKGPNYFLAKQQRTPIVDETVLAILFEQLPPAPDETAEGASGEAAGGGDEVEVAGMKVLIAGALLEIGRVEAKRGLERAGAEVVTKMDKSVQVVVAGEKGGRSLFLARELGLPILDEDALLALLERVAAEHPDAEEAIDARVELDGARVVLAGVLENIGRVEAKQALTARGAELVDEVDESVRYVVAGARAARSLLRAKQLGLLVIDETALLALLESTPELTGSRGDDAEQQRVELTGAKVAFTGSFAGLARTEVGALLAAQGAEVVAAVAPGVRYLLVGDSPNASQLFLARKLKIPELDQAAWSALLGG